MMRRALDAVSYVIFLVLLLPIRWLPERALPPLAGALGTVFCLLFPGRLRIARRNIEIAFGEQRTAAERDRLARASVRQFMLAVLECVRLPDYRGRLDEIVTAEGLEHLERAQREGHGVILLGGHFGLWELGGAALAARGCELYAVAREVDNPWIDRYLIRLREQLGVRTIPRRGAMAATLRILRRGGVVAVLADQHSSRSAVTVPFFGRPASTVATVARLALQTGAAILPGSVLRTAPMRHHVKLFPPLEAVRTGCRERDVAAITTAINEAYERMILERPDHWLWIHRRWKTLERLERRGARPAQHATENAQVP